MKKRIAAYLSIFILVLTLFSSMTLPLSAADPEAFGTTRTSVTSGETYTISTPEELIYFSTLSRSPYSLDYSGITLLLKANITISGKWISVPSFYGVLDGGSFTVTITEWFECFVGTNNGSIKNLTLSATIDTTSTGSIGGVAGLNNGTIDNCHFTGGIYNTNRYGCGGLVGWNAGTIINCSNTGDVNSFAMSDSCGGIAGCNTGTIMNCYNTGAVQGIENTICGGIVGTNDSLGGPGVIKNCYNTGSVTSTYIRGEIVGYAFSSTQVNCYWLDSSPNYGIGQIDGSDTTQNLNSFNGSGTLSSAVDGETDLLKVLNNWAAANQTDDTGYFSWKAGTAFPTFTGYEAFGTTRTIVTPGETYTIGKQEELARYAQLTLSPYDIDYLDVTILLTADITVTNDYDPFTVGNWTSIRNFRGIFDGDGHTVVVQCSDNYSNLGFFAMNSGTIQNLTLGGSVCDLTHSQYVGGITAVNYGTIINCRNNAHLFPSPNTICMGGIAANNSGTIIGCCNTGRLYNSFIGNAGGIAGSNNSAQKIINCYNTGSVSGNTCGGIVGFAYGSILNCYNIGPVNGNDCGGIVGIGNGATISNCYNSGTVTGSTAGGIFGSLNNNSVGGNCFYLFSSSTYAGYMSNSNVSPIMPFDASCTLASDVDGSTDLLTVLNKWVNANQTETTGYYGWKAGTPYPEFTQNPVITTETLANGTQNTPYSVTLSASGPLPITWTLTAGALPNGLTLSSSGTINGTPTVGGTFNFTVQAENSYGTVSKTFSLKILALQSPLSITGILGTVTVGDTFTVGTTGGSGTGMVVYIIPEQTDLSDNPTTGVATIGITNGLVTVQKVGKFKIRAGKVGDGTYADCIVTSDFITVNKMPIAVTFTGVPASVTCGDAPFTIGLSGPITTGFTLGISNQTDLSGSPTTGVASVNSSGVVTIHKSGKFQITATRPEDDNHAGCSALSGVVTVNKAANALTLTGVPASVTYGAAPFTVGTSGGKGTGELTLGISNQTDLSGSPTTGVASISSSGVVTILKAGKFQITAVKAGDDIYDEGLAISGTVTVNRKALTVSGIGAADKDYDGNHCAIITGANTAVLTGIINGDKVSLDAANAVAFFSDSNAGNGLTVIFEGFALKGAGAGNYMLVQPASVKANIRQASPPFTLPWGLTATQGQTLANITLPKDACGVFTFEAPLTTSVGNPGENNFTVTFTPFDTINYYTVTGIVLVIKVKGTAATSSTAASTSKPSNTSPTASSAPTSSGTGSDVSAPQMGSSGSYLPILFTLLILSASGIVAVFISKKRKSK